MKITVAAIQMPSIPGMTSLNLERADGLLLEAAQAEVALAVLPEMANTGYGLIPDYAPLSEPRDGPTISHLRRRSQQWNMAIACGFVESDGHHLYDSLALCLASGEVTIYRKRHLVFWERFRFRPGREAVVANTPFGRIGFAICADMIYRRVWDDYRDRIDLAIISAAWPEFSCRETSKSHWLFGHVGPLASAIPASVAKDLGVPVVFANQTGHTQTTIPFVGTWITEKIRDRFAGQSCIADGHHGAACLAGSSEQVLLSDITLHSLRGHRQWASTSPSVFAA